MTVGTVINKAGFKAGFNPGDPSLVDIGFLLFTGGKFDREVIDPLSVYQSNAQLFILSCIY